MLDRSPPQDLSEEVAFWRDFIEWWAREREMPVPPRAWEALAYAQEKTVVGAEDRAIGKDLPNQQGPQEMH